MGVVRDLEAESVSLLIRCHEKCVEEESGNNMVLWTA